MKYRQNVHTFPIDRRRIVVLVAGLAAITSGSLSAQAISSYGEPAIEAGPSYHHASTIAQGQLDGWASVIRSRGLAEYNRALAARHYQAAYEHALDNAVRKVDVYYARKEIRNEYVVKNRRPPLTEEQIREQVQQRLPDRLNSRELSETTGHISWPSPLVDDVFADERERLNELFAQRSPADSGRGSKTSREIKRSVDRLTAIVAQRVRSGELDSEEFGVAKRFLDSLRYEARFPKQNLGIAAN